MEIVVPISNSSFARLQVRDVMRRRMLRLKETDNLQAAIALFIKNKADAVLVADDNGMPAGVVTKTEVMMAYYGQLPLETALMDLMGAPVITCSPRESLQRALLTMQDKYIHRIYVVDSEGRAVGTLSYPDVVGVLYRYCCRCESSLRNKQYSAVAGEYRRIEVQEVMSNSVVCVDTNDSIEAVISILASHRIGALLLVDRHQLPAGVVSKTDLALAYRRGVDLAAGAGEIMRRPVMVCRRNEELEYAIRRMIFAEVSRLFVMAEDNTFISGILTLTDAARARSGSCQACTNSRIIPKQ